MGGHVGSVRPRPWSGYSDVEVVEEVAMRKVVFNRYGSPEVLDVIESAEPRPESGQVRVRIHATTVTTAEAKMRRGEPRWGRPMIGVTKPRARYRTLGTEFAGVVDAVGHAVTQFREGDEVFGFAGWYIGANADYLCLPANASLQRKPAGIAFAEAAAAVDGATTALHFLRDRAGLRAGQRILIIGASGSIGTYAVQLAKRLGAEVTGVCGTSNVDLVRSLGADQVIDYRRESVRDVDERWDVVFDTVGVSSFAESKPALTNRGVFVPAVISIRSVADSIWTPLTGGQRLVGGVSMNKHEPLRYVAELLADDALRVVVDTTFPLESIREAHRLVDSGHKTGNVVIDVA